MLQGYHSAWRPYSIGNTHIWCQALWKDHLLVSGWEAMQQIGSPEGKPGVWMSAYPASSTCQWALRAVSTRCCREQGHKDSHSCHLGVWLRGNLLFITSALYLQSEGGREDVGSLWDKGRYDHCRCSPTEHRHFVSVCLHAAQRWWPCS